MPNCQRPLLALLLALVGTACGGPTEEASPSAAAAPTPSTAPLPAPMHGAYALQWVEQDVPATLQRGTVVPVQVKVKNTGDWTWPDPSTAQPGSASGAHAVRLGYSWARPGEKPAYDSRRADLAAPVGPGETASFTIQVGAPGEPGDYQLQLDLVEELVIWFRAKGADTLIVPVQVE